MIWDFLWIQQIVYRKAIAWFVCTSIWNTCDLGVRVPHLGLRVDTQVWPDVGWGTSFYRYWSPTPLPKKNIQGCGGNGNSRLSLPCLFWITVCISLRLHKSGAKNPTESSCHRFIFPVVDFFVCETLQRLHLFRTATMPVLHCLTSVKPKPSKAPKLWSQGFLEERKLKVLGKEESPTRVFHPWSRTALADWDCITAFIVPSSQTAFMIFIHQDLEGIDIVWRSERPPSSQIRHRAALRKRSHPCRTCPSNLPLWVPKLEARWSWMTLRRGWDAD